LNPTSASSSTPSSFPILPRLCVNPPWAPANDFCNTLCIRNQRSHALYTPGSARIQSQKIVCVQGKLRCMQKQPALKKKQVPLQISDLSGHGIRYRATGRIGSRAWVLHAANMPDRANLKVNRVG
jgi:hypothetical protein